MNQPPPARLLVVDDNEDNRETLARRLQRRGFDVGVAADGFKALDAVAREAYDLVLLDVQMPGMSGFDVLKQLRVDHPPTRLPVIIATARTEREDVVEALKLGANDYVTKPFDFPVVLARVETQLAHKRAVDRIVSLEEDLRRRNEELEEHNRRMRRSLELAADMQRALLPSGPLDGAADVRYASTYHPCDELGGDILNIFPIGSRHVGLYLLDVSGHGVPAALLSVTLSRMLQARPGQSSLVARAGETGLEPRSATDVLLELNRRFPMDDHLEQYFTIFYGVLDVGSGVLRFASAGHPPALYLPADGPSRFLDSSGFAIGWMPDAKYPEQELPMRHGDRLLVYSDGIIETANGQAEAFGRDRLNQTADAARQASLDQLLEHVVRAADDFRGAAAAADDVSALVVEWAPSVTTV